MANVRTGKLFVLVPNMLFLQRLMYGAAYHGFTASLLVAGTEKVNGTDEGRIFVFDVTTGVTLASCGEPDLYPTDITIVGGTAYASNSAQNNGFSVEITSAVLGECVTATLPLPADLVSGKVDPSVILGK